MRLRDHPPRLLTHSDARRRHCFDDKLLKGTEPTIRDLKLNVNANSYSY
jgi:hypothetical protein